ncbi:putative mitochondrial protein [Andalucia godoyi]|uniref:Putative mitochondrial protein n=1 Tax=Andalucia godoyi TaxID=505711 RepID=A0A8K0F4M3_ANDGO|nr:putative mitochondrial protein [Andalucia godoyi]|eukprot:ANDGO_02127.mRNA.1 putative mitochondrial protein
MLAAIVSRIIPNFARLLQFPSPSVTHLIDSLSATSVSTFPSSSSSPSPRHRRYRQDMGSVSQQQKPHSLSRGNMHIYNSAPLLVPFSALQKIQIKAVGDNGAEVGLEKEKHLDQKQDEEREQELMMMNVMKNSMHDSSVASTHASSSSFMLFQDASAPTHAAMLGEAVYNNAVLEVKVAKLRSEVKRLRLKISILERTKKQSLPASSSLLPTPIPAPMQLVS